MVNIIFDLMITLNLYFILMAKNIFNYELVIWLSRIVSTGYPGYAGSNQGTVDFL